MREDEQQLRINFAAAFRLFSKMDMHESVANHLSAAVSQDGKKFLMNRRWMHFENITASSLQFDTEDEKNVDLSGARCIGLGYSCKCAQNLV